MKLFFSPVNKKEDVYKKEAPVQDSVRRADAVRARIDGGSVVRA